jgi:outer membrane protein TolC
MAMESNPAVRLAQLSVRSSEQNIISAQAAFLPTVSGGFSRTSTENQPQAREDGTQIVSESSQFGGQTRWNQLLPWGGANYNVTWNGSRFESSGSSSFNPRLSSSVSVNFTQPLWQGLTIDNARANVKSSQTNRLISDLQLQTTEVRLMSTVRFSYLNLIAAIEQHKVAVQNRDLAQQSLQNARARVEVGVSADIELIQEEASVADREDAVIAALAAIDDAKDQLRRLILDPARGDYWTIDLEPTETLEEVEQPQVDVNAAIRTAMANRLDLEIAQRNAELIDLNIKVSEDIVKPSVDFNLNYNAGAAGGTEFLSSGVTRVRSFGTVLGDTFAGRYPTWTVGLQVGYPIGQTQQKATLARNQIQRQQQDVQLRDLELLIVQQVRGAARDVQTSYQRVLAQQRALRFRQDQLDAEDRRFQVGLSTSFELQQRQIQLFQTRTNLLSALINYQRSLIEFERVQKIQ